MFSRVVLPIAVENGQDGGTGWRQYNDTREKSAHTGPAYKLLACVPPRMPPLPPLPAARLAAFLRGSSSTSSVSRGHESGRMV
uniref:Uncharacterized protein n=1 Tax=Pristionchus pacificus TaxID=54126 RepID=A0A2A6BGZ4_PRIPA|eukprot:PDM65123.1 hypothetical protein PRIPAC_53372 [Pristionchus pacificus]